MPQPQPQTQIIDGLWHCLCPSFRNSSSLLIPLQVARRRPLAQCQRIIPSSTRGVSTTIASHSTEAVYYKDKHIGVHTLERTHWNRRNEAKRAKVLVNLEELRTQPTEHIHRALQRAADSAHWSQVQHIVKILIREKGEKPDKVHFQALVLAEANLEHGSAAEVERLLQEMKESGIVLDAGLCSAVLKVLAIHPHYMLRNHIIREMEESWFELTPANHEYIATALLREHQFELAWNYYIKAQSMGFEVSGWLQRLFLYAMTTIKAWPEVHQLLDSQLSGNFGSITPGLWLHLLDTATREHYQPIIQQVWKYAVKLGTINPPSGLCTSILESCAANGDTGTAAEVFLFMTQRSTPLQTWHYESLLEGYFHADDLKGALSTIQIMTRAGFPLSEASTRSIYTILCSHQDLVNDILGCITSPQPLGYAYAFSDKRLPAAFLDTVLEALIQVHDLPTAISTAYEIEPLFPQASLKISTFNVLLQGCSQSKAEDARSHAKDLVLAIEKRKLNPTALTYDRLILVCISSKTMEDLEDAWQYYNKMHAAAPKHDPVQLKNWKLRWGTIKTLVKAFAQHGDDRASRILDRCLADGWNEGLVEGGRREMMECWPRGKHETRQQSTRTDGNPGRETQWMRSTHDEGISKTQLQSIASATHS